MKCTYFTLSLSLCLSFVHSHFPHIGIQGTTISFEDTFGRSHEHGADRHTCYVEVVLH